MRLGPRRRRGPRRDGIAATDRNRGQNGQAWTTHVVLRCEKLARWRSKLYAGRIRPMLQAKSIAEFGRSDFESIAEGTADDIRIVSGQIHEGLMSKTHDVPRPCQLPHSCFAVT